MPTAAALKVTVRLKRPHPRQETFLRSQAPRRVVMCGRRSGKTTGLAILAVEQFLRGERVLYAVPTADQLGRFWKEVTTALYEPIKAGLFKKNETEHSIELPWTEQRLKAKTAWNSDTLRGDYANLLIMDEWSLCNEDAWSIIGAPMMLDTNGKAVFAFTPPSFRSAGVSKAHDPRHAVKMFQQAREDSSGRWAAFHFTSHDNPHLSRTALKDITGDMTTLAYRQEILAEDIDAIPGALWTPQLIEEHRVRDVPELTRLVIGIDPGHDAGIVAVGKAANGHAYVLEDLSCSGSPDLWASQAIAGFYKHQADTLVAERNHGGEMVETTIKHVDKRVTVKTVWASRGKYARAEPVSVLYAKGQVHHVGVFGALEAEMCSWVPDAGHPSPNRLDGLVWGITDLLLGDEPKRAGAFGR